LSCTVVRRSVDILPLDGLGGFDQTETNIQGSSYLYVSHDNGFGEGCGPARKEAARITCISQVETNMKSLSDWANDKGLLLEPPFRDEK
jgi:hypothetical protein